MWKGQNINEGQGFLILTRIVFILWKMEESGSRNSILSISSVFKVHNGTDISECAIYAYLC